MKVFAHYECNENIEYRWRTLLQFGSSWDVLGSVVMKNPGSARPCTQIKEGSDYKELLSLIRKMSGMSSLQILRCIALNDCSMNIAVNITGILMGLFKFST